MEANLYNQKGEEKGKIKIPASIFDVKWNADLVYQIATSMMSNARKAIAHTKTEAM